MIYALNAKFETASYCVHDLKGIFFGNALGGYPAHLINKLQLSEMQKLQV